MVDPQASGAREPKLGRGSHGGCLGPVHAAARLHGTGTRPPAPAAGLKPLTLSRPRELLFPPTSSSKPLLSCCSGASFRI